MNEEIEKVTEEVAENTEAQTVEEIEEGIELTDTPLAEETIEEETVEEKEEEQPKGRYITDEELDEIVMKKVNRKISKYEARREKELSIYKDTENVLKKGLGVNDISEANQKLRGYYESEGVDMPAVYTPGLSSRETQILAKADAEEIIDDGYDAMVNEANRLASKRYENLNERERIIFDTLAEKLTDESNKRELRAMGAKEELLTDNDFMSFKSKFNSNVPMKDIYEMYQSRLPKKDIKPMGSMKDNNVKNIVEKDTYTPEEVNKLTPEDWAKPGVWEKVRASQRKWKQ